MHDVHDDVSYHSVGLSDKVAVFATVIFFHKAYPNRHSVSEVKAVTNVLRNSELFVRPDCDSRLHVPPSCSYYITTISQRSPITYLLGPEPVSDQRDDGSRQPLIVAV